MGASEKDDVPVGAKVRVNKSVVVYHVPKTKGAATDLNGMEGEVEHRERMISTARTFQQSSGESCFAESGWKWQNVLGTRDSRRDRNPVI